MVTAPVSSCLERIFQDAGLPLDDSFLQCWAAGKAFVSFDELASSHCRLNSKSSIGHDTSNFECRMAGTWGACAFIVMGITEKAGLCEVANAERGKPTAP